MNGDQTTSLPLKRYILISLAAHLLLVVFFYLVPLLFAWKQKDYKVVWVELPKGIGYDTEAIKKTEGLPRSSIQDQKQSLDKPEAKEAEKPKDTAPQAPEEKRLPEDKPAVEEPLKIKEADQETKPPPKAPEEKPRPKPTPSKLDQEIAQALQKNKQAVEKTKAPIEAAQVSQEGQGAGSASTLKDARLEDPVFAQYYALIRARINKEWVTAPKLFDQSEPLRAQLLVMMDKSGTVTSTEFVASSGNYSFDLSAKRAVERASPLPTPPAELEDEAVGEGFLIEFSPARVERQ